MNKIIILLIPTLALLGCAPKKALPEYLATPSHPVTSPSGAYKLTISTGDDTGPYWKFAIVNAHTGQVDFQSSDKFYIRHRTFFLWGEGDSVWVYSGDVGTYFWSKKTDGVWNKNMYKYGSKELDPPDGLRQLEPKWFSGESQ